MTKRLPNRRLLWYVALLIVPAVLFALRIDTDAQSDSTDEVPIISDDTSEALAQHAIEYTRQNAMKITVAPTVLLSKASTPDELESHGLGIGQFEAGCDITAHMVILKGGFDMNGLIPSGLRPQGTAMPAQYIGYVYTAYEYDARGMVVGGQISAISSSIDGSMFKSILDDPSLPDLQDAPAVTQGKDAILQPCIPAMFPLADTPSVTSNSTD